MMTKLTLMVALSLFGACSSSKDPQIAKMFDTGLSQMRSGEHHAAIRSFRQVLKFDSHNKDALNNLGIVYAAVGEYQLSEKTFLQALEIDSAASQIKFNLGQLYKRTKRYLEAEKALKEAGENQDFFDRPRVFYQLGDLYLTTGKHQKAILQLERAVRLQPSFCQAHLRLGKVYRQKANWVGAMRAFAGASNGDCVKNRKSLLYLAEAQMKLGQASEATNTLKSVIKLFSGEKVASIARKRLKAIEARSGGKL